MNDRTLLDFLALQNKWWYAKKEFPFNKTKPFKRRDYFYFLKQIESDVAIVLVGPRGVGKSTILFEIIRYLLGFSEEIPPKEKVPEPTKGVDKRRIIYLTFEETALQKYKIIDVLSVYSKYVLKEDLAKLSQRIFVFIDELQSLDDWGTQIKVLQDMKLPIKFFVSGSSSVEMQNEASKGARRVQLQSVHPLKLCDFLKYKLEDRDFEEVLKTAMVFRTELLELSRRKKYQDVYDFFVRLYNDLKKWQTQIELFFEEYLIKGGYPELLDKTDYLECSSILNQTFWLGFHKDLVLSKGVGHPTNMRDLVNYIASVSSFETNYTSLMKNSNSATNTEMLQKYLYHLEQAYLVDKSFLYTGKLGKRPTKFKIYLMDIAIRNMLTGMMNELLLRTPVQFGITLETMVFDHLKRFYFKTKGNQPLQYWKDPRTDQEIDILMDLKDQKICFEVKKAEEPSLKDVEALVNFCRGDSLGIVLCGKRLDLEKNILFLPYWLFILIC